MSGSRSELVSEIVWLDQIAALAKVESAKKRAELAADAAAEYAEQGTAPTWRIPDVATVSASISHQAVVVDDERRFAGWAARRYPTEVEVVVRPVWSAEFRSRCGVEGEAVCDPSTGEVVPGLAVRPGDRFTGVSIRVSSTARGMFAALAKHGLQQLALTAGPHAPVTLEQVQP